MRQLTDTEQIALEKTLHSEFGNWEDTFESSPLFLIQFGFTAGLEYQDKRIEALEDKINKLQAIIDKRDESVSLAEHLLTIAPNFGWQVWSAK